ncbi:MAG: serine/threonine-protein phosphatase [Candidatus Leucobacter sulfamidivorax]|nr:serine/threonine-protein phosphatase [Candidatus Leucobacter sulfamidivorax]
MRLLAAGTEPVIEVAARTDVGLKRAVNEDAVLAADPCFLVADGMGGHEAGDRASRAAIAAFGEAFTRPGHATLEEIDRALEAARAAVQEVSDGTRRGAGCTLTGVIRTVHEDEPYWYVLNVGDSRVYLHRGSELVQLTQDHSLREELRGSGEVGADATPRNVITRALGSEDDRHDAWLLPLENGSRLLICSDGLTTEVEDEDLRAVLTVGGRPTSVAEELLRRAHAGGGRDNITIVVLDVVSGGAAPRDNGEAGVEDTLEQTRPGRR